MSTATPIDTTGQLRGSTLPRIYTLPLPGRRREDVAAGRARAGACPCGCALSEETSDGFAAIEWIEGGEGLSLELFPWERWLTIHALELTEDLSLYRFRTILALVARQNGKTTIKAAITLWRMFERGDKYLVGTAQDLSQAREVMSEVLVPMIEDRPELRSRFDPDNDTPALRTGVWHKTLNNEYIRLDGRWGGGRMVDVWGPRYLIKALNQKAGRGLAGVAEVNIDELREQRDWDGWSAISKTMMANDHGQLWCMSNAGDEESVVLLHLRSVGLSGDEPTLFLAEWSAPEGCELDDPSAWAAANPSMNYPGALTDRAIASAMRTDPAAVFRTEVLCQFVESLTSAMDSGAWSACADAAGSVGRASWPALGVECSVDAEQVVAVAASWAGSSRVRLDVVGVWGSTTAAREGLAELGDVLRPCAAAWAPRGPGSRISASMRQLRIVRRGPAAQRQGPAKATELAGTKLAEAHMTFADWVDQRKVLHSDDPTLNAHVARVGSVGTPTSWMFDRGPGEVHGAWAAAAALHALLAGPRPRGRVRREILLPE